MIWLPSPPLYENYPVTVTYNFWLLLGFISLEFQQHLQQMKPLQVLLETLLVSVSFFF